MISSVTIIFQLAFSAGISQALPDLKTGFFAEVYDETIYMRNENRNTITMAQMLEGLRVRAPKNIKWDTYIKFRYGNDANRDFWNNRVEFMAGTRVRFFTKVYLALYSEYVMGEYLKRNDELSAYSLTYEDVRHGLIFWHGWDGDPYQEDFELPFSGWSEVYADLTYLKRDRHNLILFFDGKLGMRILRYNQFNLTPYVTTYLHCDANADFWNNRYAYGAGIRLMPYDDLDIQIRIEYLWGGYFDRKGDYDNPYSKIYQDFRIGLFFWHGWE